MQLMGQRTVRLLVTVGEGGVLRRGGSWSTLGSPTVSSVPCPFLAKVT